MRYYNSFTDDFEQSKDQNFSLPEDYKWVRKDIFSRILSVLVYLLAILFGFFYCKFSLHLKIKGRKKLKGIRGGFFLYGNHTQPIGDVFLPALCALPKRIYTVVSTANYGIPLIGKLLPFLGALPVVQSLRGVQRLGEAMEYRLKRGHPIVIYPEAHVWEYYTKIRPFPDTAFRFPVKMGVPAFAMTVTYKKSGFFKKPITEVFLDGPFYAEGKSTKEKTAHLHEQVFRAMVDRSRNSNLEYITYKENKT